MKDLGLALLLGVVLGVAGCGEPPKPTKVPIPPAAKKSEGVRPSPATSETKVEPPLPASYTYDPKGKPDPFRPLYTEKVEKPGDKKTVEISSQGATPLERIELGHLKLVALVWNVPEPRAMVEDSAGKGYILTLGTSVGKSQGKVTQITSSAVIVNEKYIAPDGKVKHRDVPLKLYPD